MPDLTIKTQAVEVLHPLLITEVLKRLCEQWSDVAKEFTPLRAENTTALNEHSTPTSEGGPETFTFIHTLAAHGEGSHLVREELFAVDAQVQLNLLKFESDDGKIFRCCCRAQL
jgi:hypothetical protein